MMCCAREFMGPLRSCARRTLYAWPARTAAPLHVSDPEKAARVRVGFELVYDCRQTTPMMLVLNVHYSRAPDLVVPDHLTT
jgi:hypothetical protein